MSFKDKLKSGVLNWGSAKKAAQEGTGFPEFDPGRYNVQLSKAEIKESKKGSLMCQWTLNFLDGKYQGKSIMKFSMLESDQNLEFFAKDIMRLEWEFPDDPDQIEETLEEIVKADLVVQIEIVKNGDYTNIYFQKVLEGVE